MKYLTLSNGVKIPQIGFGVYQIPDYEEAKRAVLAALRYGYRLIDTAQGYMNEVAVGDAIRESGIPREEVFITSKLWLQDFSFEGAQAATQTTLERIGYDYIDLMLLHQPMGDYIGAWRGLENSTKRGKSRPSVWRTAIPMFLPTFAKPLKRGRCLIKWRCTPSSSSSLIWTL